MAINTDSDISHKRLFLSNDSIPTSDTVTACCLGFSSTIKKNSNTAMAVIPTFNNNICEKPNSSISGAGANAPSAVAKNIPPMIIPVTVASCDLSNQSVVTRLMALVM